MKPIFSKALARRSWLPLLIVAVAVASTLALVPFDGDEASAASEADSDDGPVIVAGSVCEAQFLKKQAEDDPSLRYEIPPEYDKALPSYNACLSHELAWDEDAPGPNQPIPFSHQHHAGEYQIQCLYCHSGTDRSQYAGMPSVELCMGCHQHFSSDYDQLEGIQILKRHWEEQEPIEWIQIHRVPEHVQFKHNRHVAAGLDCNQCHGSTTEPVENQHKLYLVPDTKWWGYGLPARKLQMGWCIQCHRENGASEDCLTCHY